MWINALGYRSLDNPILISKIRSRYETMTVNSPRVSIVLGIKYDSVENIAGEEYAIAIRKAMHKWMFNY
jgi:hypothetical protein